MTPEQINQITAQINVHMDEVINDRLDKVLATIQMEVFRCLTTVAEAELRARVRAALQDVTVHLRLPNGDTF